VINKGITEEELQKAKNIKEASFVSDKQDVLSKAESLAATMLILATPDLSIPKSKIYESNIGRRQKSCPKILFDRQRVVLIYKPKSKS
jgi:hypothetical protein